MGYITSKLFPVIDWAFGDAWHGPDWEGRWASEKRLCSSRYFDRYFALRVPDGRMSDSEFEDFIEHAGDREYVDQAFADLTGRDLLAEILSRMEHAARTERLPMEHLDVLIPALFDVAEPLPATMGFSDRTPFISAWCAASWSLEREADPERRGAIFLQALKDSESLAVPAVLISFDIDKRAKREGDPLMTDAQLGAAKAAWVKSLTAALERAPEAMLENHHFVSHLYRWRDFDSLSEPRAWVAGIIAQPALLPKFIKAFVHEGQSLAAGDFATRPLVQFQMEALDPLVDISVLADLVRGLPQDVDPAERAACDRFLKEAEKHLAKVAKQADDTAVGSQPPDLSAVVDVQPLQEASEPQPRRRVRRAPRAKADPTTE